MRYKFNYHVRYIIFDNTADVLNFIYSNMKRLPINEVNASFIVDKKFIVAIVNNSYMNVLGI